MSNKNSELQILSHYIDRLKCEKRRIWKTSGGQESVAAHSWGISLLLVYCLPHLKIKVDTTKLFKLATIHDFPEAISGDTPFLEVFRNPLLKEKKQAEEEHAVSCLEARFPGHFGEEVADLWKEYSAGQTNEAKVIKALDKIEAQLQQQQTDCVHWGPIEFIKHVHTSLRKLCACDPFLAAVAEQICFAADEKLTSAQTVG